MDCMKEPNKYSTEFKRQLINEVKKQPFIWTKGYFGKEYAWKEIEKGMHFSCTIKDLQKVWASLRRIYFRKIFIRTIERCFEAPNWIFFHDLAFLYDITKENIQRKLGGISPPLFKPKPNGNGSQNVRCPCCIYVEPHTDSEPIICSTEDKQEDEFDGISNKTSEQSFAFEDCSSNSSALSETTLSICSLDDEDNENQTCFWTNSPKTQENETDNSVVLPSSHDTFENKTCDVIDLSDDIETCIKSPKPCRLENVTENPPNVNPGLPLLDKMGLFVLKSSAQSGPLGLNNHTSSINKDDCPANIKIAQEPEALSLDLTQSPGPSERTANGLLTSDDKSNDSSSTSAWNEIMKIKNKLPIHIHRAVERSKIIEAVKANPLCYFNYNNKRRTLHNQAWNKVSEAVGLPVYTVKNRWKFIKTRYLKELVNERYSNGRTKSQWECFEQMEFLRSSMQKEINDIHDTRIQMQDTIRKSATKDAANITDGANDSPQLNMNDKSHGTYVHTLKNMKIASVESLKQIRTYSRKSKQVNQSPVLDENVLPILQNRPVKITGVHVLQPNYLPNNDNLNRSINYAEAPPIQRNGTNVLPSETPKVLHSMPEAVIIDRLKCNEELPPPAKKLRQCTNLTETKVQNLATPTPKSSSLSSANCMTLDLTADTATTDPVLEVQPERLQFQKPQKIYPPLDLTLDEDPSEYPTVSKKVATSNFQQSFVDEFVNTNQVFPTLDLTTEEDMDQDNTVINSDEIATRSAEINEKEDENVVCLDDDDSVSLGSYEELIVYVAEENKN